MHLRNITFSLFQLTVLAIQAGCLLLLVMARFGQNPPETLPLATIVFFGAMLSGPLHSLSRDWSGRRFAAATAVAVAASLLLSLLLQGSADHRPERLLAPAVALPLTGLLGRPAGSTGAMLRRVAV